MCLDLADCDQYAEIRAKEANKKEIMKTLSLFACCVAVALGGDTYPRQNGVDAIHYRFSLSFQDDTNELQGEAVVDLRFVAAGVQEVALDLDSTGMKVSEVLPATGLTFAHANDRLVLRLIGEAPKAGERRQFTIRYRGTPAGGLRIMKNKYGERVFFSENWPNKARHWLPMIDHPYDKATSEFLVTAPAEYQVVSNGLLQEETDLGGGRRLTHWKQSVPIASWLNAIGIARFSVHHAGLVKGVPLQTWVYHQDREAGPPWFEATSRKAVEFFSEAIGPYSYEKLANVAAAGFGGGTEHASAIFYGENNILERPGTGLIAHEIAHQWFGNAITEKDWDDVWLSEGFATYFTNLYFEHWEGRDTFVTNLQSARKRIYGMEKATPGLTVQHRNISDMKRILNRLIYEKGGWTLHMLRGMMGTEKFWQGIRTYYATYRNGSASTADFRRVMEETAGLDLGWFFDQWLTRSTSPVVEGTWRWDAASKKVIVELAQTQPGDPYRLPIEIGLGAQRVEKAEMTGKRGVFEFQADQEPASVVFDPNTWLLANATLTRAAAK